MKRIITTIAALLICSHAAAQNTIPRNFYNNQHELEQAAIERLRIIELNKANEQARIYKHQNPLFFAQASALLSKGGNCGTPKTDTIFTLAEDSFAHLQSKFFLQGWAYAVQDCWVFVNQTHSDGKISSSENELYFKAIEHLQKEGLLTKELIRAPLRGSTVVYAETEGQGARAITAFRLADLKFYR